jgi:hypothetical protein
MLPAVFLPPKPNRPPPRKATKPVLPARPTAKKGVAFIYFICQEGNDLRLFLVGHKRQVFQMEELNEARRWGVPGGNVDKEDEENAAEADMPLIVDRSRAGSPPINQTAFWSASREFAEEVIGYSAKDDNFNANVKQTAENIVSLCRGDIRQIERVTKSEVKFSDGRRGDLITTATSFVVMVPPIADKSAIKRFESMFFGDDVANTFSDTQKLGLKMNFVGEDENNETLGFVWGILDSDDGYAFRDLRGDGTYEYLFENSPQDLDDDEMPMIVFEPTEERRDDVVLLLRGGMNARVKVVMAEIVKRVRDKRQKKK